VTLSPTLYGPCMRLGAERKSWRRAGCALLLLCLLLAAPTSSLAADADIADGGVQAAVVDAGLAVDAPELEPRAAQIRALIAGSLPVSVDPQSLFVVPVTDEPAQQVERIRLAALLSVVDERADAGVAPSVKVKAKLSRSASKLAASADAAVLSSKEWLARDRLDRVRLEYYSLSKPQRDELLLAHSARVEAAKPKETDEQRHAREAEQDRKRALEAAQLARTEAERLVGKELARLIGLELALSKWKDHFNEARVALASRKESLLGWQKRVGDAMSTTELADETYDALRRTLRVSREELGRALDEVDSAHSLIPEIGPSPLSDIPANIALGEVSKRRKAVQAQVVANRAEERAVRTLRAAVLLIEVDTLNNDRLKLLAALSPEKRAGIIGFTLVGLEQSRYEARQLLLILRYHAHVARGWLRELRSRQRIQGVSFWPFAAVAVFWLLGFVGFVWLRRRSPRWLSLIDERLGELERREQRSSYSVPRKAVRFLMGFYRTLESLLFFALTVWLLPPSADGLLEVQLAEVVIGWLLGGALIVNVINSLAASGSSAQVAASDEIPALRLRSLRLVGRTVVGFMLALLVCERLVGRGTVYSWVYSTCWFAAIPVFLILIRWWREVVFQRVERVRRKSELQAWVLLNRSGWKSFFAAMIAAVQLFVVGFYKTLRNWLTHFNLARRAHAYLFKRELARLANDQPPKQALPLNEKALSRLSPTQQSDGWVSCLADDHIDALAARAHAGRGGVVALVGGRGMGKSCLLRRLEIRVASAVALACRGDGDGQLRAACAGEGAGGAGSAARPLRLVLLDDAQRLIKPVRGGLRPFDEALAFARSRSADTLWVFAIDAVVWPFLMRARDSRSLFDQVLTLQPWTDEQIGELLALRSAEAEVAPTFEDLLEKLPPAADEIDKQEALWARQVGYFRMVWDYTRGNPAMALEVWRTSLSEDEAGAARVHALSVPDSGELSALPDSALFILRAIMQLEPATVAEIAKSTRVAEAHVLSAVTLGVQRGYLAADGDSVRVAWAWLRSIIVLLERRHLLVSS